MKYYCLDFFPYPSGAGLTIGHCRNYVPTDVVSRYYRMRGYDVLHPMGWDAFGLPAENEAIRHGVHPADSTARYAANYKRQMQLIRCAYDWEREINSSDPAYYRWTQWFFLLLHRRGLAYRAAAPVNWCTGCQTVLAHEEVEEGVCWRCGSEVIERSLPQWWFRTTAYREQLAAGLDEVDWPPHIAAMQRRWIAGLRDWLVSRQRYWGAPIPIVHCPDCGIVPVPEEQLPVRLPPLPAGAFEPRGDGRSPLANIPEFANTTCPRCGQAAQRETDTMAGSVCSSWYFLRFASPHEDRFAFDREEVQRWLPADLYAGGAEHATGHLLYARFFTRVLSDAGLIDFSEPFPVLRSQGIVHASDGRRMSKSRPETVVTPDDVVARHGADALRAHVLFIAPFDANVTWDESAINGVVRWMERVRRVAGKEGNRGNGGTEGKGDEALRRGLHRTIRKVSEDIEGLKFNTAIAALMSFTSQMLDAQGEIGGALWQECCVVLTCLLAPFTPDLAEELWQTLGEEGSVHSQPWPQWHATLAAEETVIVVVQVNGKVRARVTIPAASDDEQTAALALADEAVADCLAGRQPKRMIVAPGRLVNIVV